MVMDHAMKSVYRKLGVGGPSPFGFALGRSAQGFGYFCRAAEPALSLSKGSG